MTNREIQIFLNSHRDFELSPAKMEYTRFLCPEIEEEALKISGVEPVSEEDTKMATVIADATRGEELIQLMRKRMSWANRDELRKKVLANEDALIPLIQKKSITNNHDVFIEDALYFFLRCKTNVSNWFVENYKDFRSEYLRSMFCLILGFRGEKEMIPFLINEAERFERLYPDETYDQGPALAVERLVWRYYN